MKRKLMSTSIIVLIVLILLILPLIFKDRNRPALIGPGLSELEYSEIFFKNRYEGFRLSGMLFLPEGEGSQTIYYIMESPYCFQIKEEAKNLKENG